MSTLSRWRSGDRVVARSERWNVLDETPFVDCAALRLVGAAPGNFGRVRTLPTPFDRPRAVPQRTSWQAVRPRRWLHALRRSALNQPPTRRPAYKTILRGNSCAPKEGGIIPKMGMRKRGPDQGGALGLADALFSKTQQRVLGLLFANPERSFYASEIVARARGGTGTVVRELARLEASGLVNVKRVGNQKHYQANPTSPLFEELRSIIEKTVGLAAPVRRALDPVASKI